MTPKQAQQRNHWIMRAAGNLHLLASVPDDILEQCRYSHVQLTDVVIALQDAIRDASYTYSTCQHCKTSLTGRNHQSRNEQRKAVCDVCGSSNVWPFTTKISRMKIPLHEARSRMRVISPELFI